MVQITDQERKQIQKRFPQAKIVNTRHNAFLVCREVDEIGRFLFSIRGADQPPTRRERERLGDRYGHLFSDRSPRRRP